MISPEEKELLASIRRGETAGLKALFEKYHASLCSTAFRLIRSHDTAKDIVQEVFIKFWNNRASIEITSSLQAYLRRSVINATLNQMEKEQRHSKVEIEQLQHHPSGTSSDDHHTTDELTREFENAVNSLPVRTRAVFLLIRREEMSYKEVAESLNISLKAVEKEMMKALKLLREMLKDLLPLLVLVQLF